MAAAEHTPPSFELQGHSTQSDGELPPRETVQAAHEAGVELFALTDHDSLEGVEEAARAAREAGLAFVTGVEISVIDPAGADLHVCGYLVDPGSAALREQLARSRADRERRAERMRDALTELGWAVDQRVLDERAQAGLTIGRPHLAKAVADDPRNAERLRREGLAGATEFLVAYLIEGRPAFREREAPTVAQAIQLIHDAGGVAVWAHPFWDVDAASEVVATLERFAALGLDGVEAFYVTHTREQTDLLVEHAARLDLLTTGSSDFHGPNHRQFNRFRQFSTYGHAPNLGPIALTPRSTARPDAGRPSA